MAFYICYKALSKYQILCPKRIPDTNIPQTKHEQGLVLMGHIGHPTSTLI